MVPRSVVLPGDFITASSVSATTNRERIVGAGLAKRDDGIYTTVAGVLNERSDKLWVSSAGKRYLPKAGDKVLGIVTARAGDYFRVDMGGPDLAQLSFLSFEGATKRNRPAVKVGDLVYCQVTLCAKNLEPEVSCIDAEFKARGMGLIPAPGLVIPVSLNYARRLLSPNDSFLTELGREIKFETSIGMNGRIWISGGNKEVLAVKDAILEWASAHQSQLPSVVDKAVRRARGIELQEENTESGEREKEGEARMDTG